MRRFVRPHSTRPTPLQLFCSLRPIPIRREEGMAVHPTAIQHCTVHTAPEDLDQGRDLWRKTKKNFHWKKWHLQNGRTFHPTLQMPLYYEEKKSEQSPSVERSAILTSLLVLYCSSNLLVFNIPSTPLSALLSQRHKH